MVFVADIKVDLRRRASALDGVMRIYDAKTL
jgi:hypothetical protein